MKQQLMLQPPKSVSPCLHDIDIHDLASIELLAVSCDPAQQQR